MDSAMNGRTEDGRVRVRAKLIFHDWLRDGRSVYQSEEGVRLSSGQFHSGSTFDGEIVLEAEYAEELLEDFERGYRPAFWLMKE